MGSDKSNEIDPAAAMHAEIVRRGARELRQDQRRMACIFADRGMEPARIGEILEIDMPTVQRMLAAGGHLICTECAFDRHVDCLGEMWHDGINAFTRCECSGCDMM